MILLLLLCGCFSCVHGQTLICSPRPSLPVSDQPLQVKQSPGVTQEKSVALLQVLFLPFAWILYTSIHFNRVTPGEPAFSWASWARAQLVSACSHSFLIMRGWYSHSLNSSEATHQEVLSHIAKINICQEILPRVRWTNPKTLYHVTGVLWAWVAIMRWTLTCLLVGKVSFQHYFDVV